MGDVYWGVHLPLAAAAASLGIEVAVETGTYFGAGAIHLSALFDTVWTIERDLALHQFCVETYSELCPSVEFVHGDSGSTIGGIVAALEQPALYVLDAHWFPAAALSGEVGLPQCTLLQELRAIASGLNCGEGSVVIVDDADMFLGSLPLPFRPEDFPSIDEIVCVLQEELGATFVRVVDDVIVGGPSQMRGAMNKYLERSRGVGGPSSKRIAL